MVSITTFCSNPERYNRLMPTEAPEEKDYIVVNPHTVFVINEEIPNVGVHETIVIRYKQGKHVAQIDLNSVISGAEGRLAEIAGRCLDVASFLDRIMYKELFIRKAYFAEYRGKTVRKFEIDIL